MQTPAAIIECGEGVSSDDNESSGLFSDVEEGSCFYSTVDGDDGLIDEEIMKEATGSRRGSSVAESEFSVCIVENSGAEIEVHLEKQQRDCRICQLSLISKGPEPGIPIELGCSCKGDLAAAHTHCAETWFKIKGNKICEICNAIARNVVGESVVDCGQQTNETGTTTAAASEVSDTTSEIRGRCCDGRFVNFLLACLVFVFVLSWLFHFNIHS